MSPPVGRQTFYLLINKIATRPAKCFGGQERPPVTAKICHDNAGTRARVICLADDGGAVAVVSCPAASRPPLNGFEDRFCLFRTDFISLP